MLAKENGQTRCRIYPQNSSDKAIRDTNVFWHQGWYFLELWKSSTTDPEMLVQRKEFGVQGVVMCDTTWKKTTLTLCPLWFLLGFLIMYTDWRQNKTNGPWTVFDFYVAKKVPLMNYRNINKGEKCSGNARISLFLSPQRSQRPSLFSLRQREREREHKRTKKRKERP